MKAINPGRDYGLYGWRQGNWIDAPFQPVCSFLALKISTLDEGIDKFFQKEGVSLCALYDVPTQQCERRVCPKMILYQDGGLRLGEGKHVDLSIVRSLHQGGGKPRSKIDNQKGRGAKDSVGQRLDELQARRIDPMQILDYYNRGGIPRS